MSGKKNSGNPIVDRMIQNNVYFKDKAFQKHLATGVFDRMEDDALREYEQIFNDASKRPTLKHYTVEDASKGRSVDFPDWLRKARKVWDIQDQKGTFDDDTYEKFYELSEAQVEELHDLAVNQKVDISHINDSDLSAIIESKGTVSNYLKDIDSKRKEDKGRFGKMTTDPKNLLPSNVKGVNTTPDAEENPLDTRITEGREAEAAYQFPKKTSATGKAAKEAQPKARTEATAIEGAAKVKTLDAAQEMLGRLGEQAGGDFLKSYADNYRAVKGGSTDTAAGGADGENKEYLAKREKMFNFLKDFKAVLGPVKDAVEMIDARRHERDASAIADESMRNQPKAPAVRGENRMLSSLIRESEIARSNPNSIISPYADQVNEGYSQDLRRSEELSGGQAGVALAGGQAAALRRDRGAQEVGRMAGEVYDQGIQRTAGLVDMQGRDNAQRDMLYQRQHEQADARNIMEQQAAGESLAYARGRKLQARNNMWDSLLDSPAFNVDTYMNLTRQNLNS